MSNFIYDNHNINYEVHGKGKPLLILNGIMMTAKSWQPFLPELTKNNQVILVDFIDQGNTERSQLQHYDYPYQTNLIKGLLNHLQIEQVSIVGISYGGEIALDFASKHPKQVEKLVLFSTAPYTSPWMKEIFENWNAIGQTRNGAMYYRATIPVIYSQSFYQNNYEWMERRKDLLLPVFENEVFLNAMHRLTSSILNFDVRNQLKNITAKTLIVASEEDFLTSLNSQKEIRSLIANSRLVVIPNVGHALMYEAPQVFLTMILGFVNQTTPIIV